MADRWPSAKNRAEALERYVSRQHRLLAQVAHAVANVDAVAPTAQAAAVTQAPLPQLTPRHQERAERRARRVTRYEEAHARCGRGQSQRAIADALGLSRKTVQRYLQTATFPEMQPRHRQRRTDPFVAYLQQRWVEGCHNGRQLFRELRARGYSGGRSHVSDVVARWRLTPGHAPGHPGVGSQIKGVYIAP